MRPTYLVLVFFVFFATHEALAGSIPTPDDNQIRQQVIQQSVDAYISIGHPCACPYNLARNGSRCSGLSAYGRPGGASPLCYPSDVTDQMMFDWKQQHEGQ